MWHYGDQRFRPQAQSTSALAQSAYDLLLGMRGVAVTLLFLDISDPNRPVTELSGFVEMVNTSSLTLGLSGPLPRLDPRTRFGVEVMSGPGILRFQTTAQQPPESGSTRLSLTLPRQIESIQRRKFSRVTLNTAVAFSAAQENTDPSVQPGGLGQTLDLSAGGIRFTTQVPLRYGQTVFVSFNTPDGAIYRGLQARVARVQNEGLRYIVAVRFNEQDESLTDQLVQSVFRLQIRGLAKR
jgi:hypothetical protein